MRALLVVAALSAIARAQAAVHDDVSTALQPVRASWAANASANLDRAIQAGALYYNTSFTAAATFVARDGGTVSATAAAGYDDRVRGTWLSTASLVPGGSAIKPFTASAAMLLAERGLLDLDRPVHEYVDPWLKAQNASSPTMLQLWQGEARILNVTTRLLLSMQSGIHDYDDPALLQWSVRHPSLDYLPFDFLRSVQKGFVGPPGTSRYSGVGYVIVGMVLSACSGAHTWQELNQSALLQPPATRGGRVPEPRPFDEILFMGRGPCSRYPRVPHQYVYMYETDDWVDLYNGSCLNGWTMGNIAATALHFSSFYAALASGHVVSDASLAQMTHFRALGPSLPGAARGTPYGLGLFKLLLRFRLEGVTRCSAHLAPFCNCSAVPPRAASLRTDTRTRQPPQCFFSADCWGHGGLDWGSGFPMAGWVPALNMSFALGGTNGEGFIRGMNTSLSQDENGAAYGTVWCAVMQALVHARLPEYPRFAGWTLSPYDGEGQDCRAW